MLRDKPLIRVLIVVLFNIHVAASAASPTKPDVSLYFGIQVIDQETKRGVPLVELQTVSKARYVTDSNGWVAFYEPGQMNREVFFEVSSHGYEFPKDGFGSRGKILQTAQGKTATLEIDRRNVAQRLYRITGAGIYRDTWLLGKPVPIQAPLLNGEVVGQDTVQSTLYQDRILWIWGDTNRPRYPLGQFKTSGATSLLPIHGGLDPMVGIDLEYYVGKDGFSREMAPIAGPGAVWLHGVFTLKVGGRESVYGHYSRVKSLGEQYEHGVVVLNERTETFEKANRFPDDAMLHPRGQALAYENGLKDYIYFCRPFPSVRVRADAASIESAEAYETYTCLKTSSRFDSKSPAVEYDSEGRAVWGWKRNTDFIDARRMHQLIQGGHIQTDEAVLALRDEDKLIYVDSGSVHWNEYRKKWVMIAGQLGGEHSFIGDIWYAEAAKLEGPWENARLVAFHDKYSFYNPAHHPFFDRDGGRVILFDGTYVNTFAATTVPTPRYDYNQIMYSLPLDDRRLNLP